MLTRPEVDEAKAEAKVGLFFSAKFYILTYCLQKNWNFRSIFDGTSKISAENGL